MKPNRGGRERLEQAMDVVYRHKRMVLLTFSTVVAIAAVYAFVRKPIYQAQSIVRVELSAQPPGTNAEASAAEGDPFATNERPLSAELFFLQASDAIHQRATKRLQEVQAEVPSEMRLFPKDHVQFGVADNAANAITVIGTSAEPREASLLANLYAEEYVELTRQASRAHLSARRKLLEQQEVRRQKQLTQAEVQVEAFKREERAVGLDQEAKILVSQVATLEVQRDDARLELQTRQARLQELMQELEASNPQLAKQIASNAEQRLQTVREDIAELRAEKERTGRRYPSAERDERVRAKLRQLDQRIEQSQKEADYLAQQIIDQGSAVIGGTGAGAALARAADLRREIQQERVGIEALENRIQHIDERLTEYNAKLRIFPGQSRELAQLERRRQYAERMHQSVINRLQETRIAEESEPGYAHVLRKASVPEEPVNASSAHILVLGAFFGLSLSLSLAFLRDKLDKRLYKPEQLRERGYSVVGIIPNMQPLIKEDHQGRAFIEQDGDRFATSLIALLNPMSSAAEGYRHLRTNIQHGHAAGSTQVLLVTSPGMGEGKSTTTANLAIAMARTGRHTLLIDADLRRPQVHNLFSLQRRTGLAELLSSEIGLDFETMRTAIDHLYILPAWSPEVHADEVVGNPAELLESARLKAYLTEMCRQFDTIIIDTPPLLAATDAAVLSTQSDATLVVVRAGKTKEDELSYSMEALEEVGANIVGVVLNAFDISMAYGHKYKYQHYTKYGRYSKYGYYGHQTHWPNWRPTFRPERSAEPGPAPLE